MIPQWIIEKKRDGGELAAGDLAFFVRGFTNGSIPDYQMSALAMAVFFRGMTPRETASLTRLMLESGSTVDTSAIPLPKIDKHSTGGIGDKISLILAPLVACCGVAVPMISGRGLGLTGGTLDKLESIPGYRTGLTARQFSRVLGKCGCSIMGQTPQLAPADRKLYALRDVTGTVPSIPLITASILSKKLAEGIDGLALDVKCGRGAFMKTRRQSLALAGSLTAVAREMGVKASALVTAMDEPLGRTVGNALEVAETVAVLRGSGEPDLVKLTLALGVEMLRLAGARNPAAAGARLRQALDSGAAFDKFVEMVSLHGGDTRVIEDPRRLPLARHRRALRAARAGFVCAVDAEAIGRACILLGAGRTRTTDAVDPAAGISALRKAGEAVGKGEVLAFLHTNRAAVLDEAAALADAAFAISPARPAKGRLILDRLS